MKKTNPKCLMYKKGKCNSDYNKNQPCDLSKCPYNYGNFAMAVRDSKNRIKKMK